MAAKTPWILSATVAIIAGTSVSFAGLLPKGAQEQKEKRQAEIPVCDKKYGAIAIVEPET